MIEMELKYETRVIAFIDILGFKEIIKQSDKDSSNIELIYSVLDYFKKLEIADNWDLRLVEIEEDAQKRGVENFDIKGKINSTAFSDSIVISVKAGDNINEMTSSLIANLAYVGSIFLEKGILFRGGLTYGNIIHDSNGIVFGQGLIDSYKLESNFAKYPRIILSDKLIEKLNYPIDTKRDRYPYHQYIDRFADGCVGFNQMIYYQVMEAWIEMTTEELTEKLDKVRKVIVNGLDTSFEKPEVFEKYKWLKDQYNAMIILGDYNLKTKTGTKSEDIKIKIFDLNENIAGQNIHYSHTDNAHERIRRKNQNK